MAEETVQLARYAAALRYEDLPEAVVACAKDAIIDTVAACICGSALPWSRIVIDYAERTGPGGTSHILGRGSAVQAPAAALANGALAHAFEVELEPDPIAHDNVVPMSQRLSLLELNEATCHWPIGDPSSSEFFFCGGKALTGLPYCAHHSRVAYQPAADRRRQAAKPPQR